MVIGQRRVNRERAITVICDERVASINDGWTSDKLGLAGVGEFTNGGDFVDGRFEGRSRSFPVKNGLLRTLLAIVGS